MTVRQHKLPGFIMLGLPARRLVVWFAGLLVLWGCAGSYTGLETDGGAPLSEEEKIAGLRALLMPEGFAEYEALPDSQKSEWLRIFWQEHDPTPTTSDNEFRREHLRRLRYSLYYYSNPPGPIPWDDRGEVYIRYGEPNERRLELDAYWDRRKMLGARGARLRGLSPSAAEGKDIDVDAVGASDILKMHKPSSPFEFDGEIWDYYRFGLTFQFQDEDGLGIFTLVPTTTTFGAQDDFAEFARTKLTAVDLQPAMYFHDYGEAHLDYALDLARFRAEEKTFDVDVNLGYPLVELSRGGPDSAMISIRRALVIRDDSLREVASDLSIISRRVGPATRQQQLMVEQKVFNLPPGKYELAVSLEDLFSGKVGIYKKTFRLPEFRTREVQEISDIEMASFVWSVYDPGSPYVKANHLVMPLPSRIYMQDQPVAFYYEIYNLAVNKQDTAVYRIKYEILDPEAKHVFHEEETGKFYSADRNVSRFGTINRANLKPGEYLLSVDVYDETTRKKKRTIKRFKVLATNGFNGSGD